MALYEQGASYRGCSAIVSVHREGTGAITRCPREAFAKDLLKTLYNHENPCLGASLCVAQKRCFLPAWVPGEPPGLLRGARSLLGLGERTGLGMAKPAGNETLSGAIFGKDGIY